MCKFFYRVGYLWVFRYHLFSLKMKISDIEIFIALRMDESFRLEFEYLISMIALKKVISAVYKRDDRVYP